MLSERVHSVLQDICELATLEALSNYEVYHTEELLKDPNSWIFDHKIYVVGSVTRNNLLKKKIGNTAGFKKWVTMKSLNDVSSIITDDLGTDDNAVVEEVIESNELGVVTGIKKIVSEAADNPKIQIESDAAHVKEEKSEKVQEYESEFKIKYLRDMDSVRAFVGSDYLPVGANSVELEGILDEYFDKIHDDNGDSDDGQQL
jgi:hypothetical protein